jgi:hypothetical protein
MGSVADSFEEDLKAFKQFVGDDGRHFYVMQFEDHSGRVFVKRPTEDGRSVADFEIRSMYAMEAMRKIASSTDFEVDKDANTQQNLRNLMEA